MALNPRLRERDDGASVEPVGNDLDDLPDRALACQKLVEAGRPPSVLPRVPVVVGQDFALQFLGYLQQPHSELDGNPDMIFRKTPQHPVRQSLPRSVPFRIEIDSFCHVQVARDFHKRCLSGAERDDVQQIVEGVMQETPFKAAVRAVQQQEFGIARRLAQRVGLPLPQSQVVDNECDNGARQISSSDVESFNELVQVSGEGKTSMSMAD